MRCIMLIDSNTAYLSWSAVAMLEKGYPIDIREMPAVIAGDPASRHGIILAKSIPTKKYGIKTGRKDEEKKRKKEEFEKQILEATLQIRDNTSNLPEIVTLLRQSNLNQEEMRFVLEDIVALIMAKDKKEADSIFRRALAKINDTAQSVESIGILNQALMFFIIRSFLY